MPRDSRRVPLRVGQRVAYNRSGDVVEGIIVDVHPGHCKIMAHADFMQGRNDMVPSRVKNERSILVLAEPS